MEGEDPRQKREEGREEVETGPGRRRQARHLCRGAPREEPVERAWYGTSSSSSSNNRLRTSW